MIRRRRSRRRPLRRSVWRGLLRPIRLRSLRRFRLRPFGWGFGRWPLRWLRHGSLRRCIGSQSFRCHILSLSFFSRFFCPFSLSRFLTDLSDLSKTIPRRDNSTSEQTSLLPLFLYSSRQEISPVRSMGAKYNQVITPSSSSDTDLLFSSGIIDILPSLSRMAHFT